MKDHKTENRANWYIKDIIESNFQKNGSDRYMPQFINQSFANPFVTISYKEFGAKTWFYQAKVYPSVVQ